MKMKNQTTTESKQHLLRVFKDFFILISLVTAFCLFKAKHPSWVAVTVFQSSCLKFRLHTLSNRDNCSYHRDCNTGCLSAFQSIATAALVKVLAFKETK